MQQCVVRQFENELVERLSIFVNRHLRPPAPERGPHSTRPYRYAKLVLFCDTVVPRYPYLVIPWYLGT
jgi:hypothetical protein